MKKKSVILLIMGLQLTMLMGACGNKNQEESVQVSTEAFAVESTETQTGESVTAETEESETIETDSNEKENETKMEETDVKEESDFANVSLAELYKDDFLIGVALPDPLCKQGSEVEELISKQFNSLTCENEMKPDSLLDQKACQADLNETYENPAVHFDNCQKAIDFALAHDMKIRLHTLVWHSQTPDWFFTEDYTKDGELVSREVMLKRMENYIKNVLTYFEENYPGLIYAVDVCNEAIDEGNGDENWVRKVDNKWYDTVGDDYYYQAFVFARKYATEDMKLFYNDYGCSSKSEQIISHLAKAKEEGLIDGIGMQSHLKTSDNIGVKYLNTVKAFCDEGYEVQVTELDIGISEKNETNYLRQARKYKILFEGLKELREEGRPITSVTVWGLDDAHSWRKKEYPLLFDEQHEIKPAFEAAALSEKIPAIE